MKSKVKVYKVHKGQRYQVISTPNMINETMNDIIVDMNNSSDNQENTDIYKIGLGFDEQTGELWNVSVAVYCPECEEYHDLGMFISEEEFYDGDDIDCLTNVKPKDDFNTELPQIDVNNYDNKVKELDNQINDILDQMTDNNSDIVKEEYKVELTKLVTRKETLKSEFLK